MEKPPLVATITTIFWVDGQEFDPDQFSQIAGHRPTSIWRAKVEGVKDNPNFPQIAWKFNHTKRPRRSIDDAIRQILAVFEERREQIVAFAKQNGCSLHLSLVLHGDETVIEYWIERETVILLAAFGCSISFAINIG
jgi:hypothetical protein